MLKILIFGIDDLSLRLARTLLDYRYEVILLSENPEDVSRASEKIDCLILEGDAANPHVWSRDSLRGLDYFMAVTPHDEKNLLTANLAKNHFSVPETYALIRKARFIRNFKEEYPGITRLIHPAEEISREIVAGSEHGATSDILSFRKSGVQLRRLLITSESPVKEKTLFSVRALFEEENFIVGLVVRDGRPLIPDGKTRLKENDTIYILAGSETLDRLFMQLGKKRIPLNKVTILGGGMVGYRIARYFAKSNTEEKNTSMLKKFLHFFRRLKGRRVIVVEQNRENCQKFEELENVEVIQGNIAKENILEEEKLLNSDLLISVTGNTELNILTAVYAKSKGVLRTAALLQGPGYFHIASELGLDLPLVREDILIRNILAYVRASSATTVHAMPYEEVEILEMTVGENSPVSGKKIREIKRDKMLILHIEHRGQQILPYGDYLIKPRDEVIVIAYKNSSENIEDYFTGSVTGQTEKKTESPETGNKREGVPPAKPDGTSGAPAPDKTDVP